MENATKALLIAAAILIAIVLISIGVYVLGRGQDAMRSIDLSEAEIAAINAKFESYSGLQRGSQINQLIQRTITHDTEQLNSKTGIYVTLDVQDDKGETARKISVESGKTEPTDSKTDFSASTGDYYMVTITKDNAGVVKTITAKKQAR